MVLENKRKFSHQLETGRRDPRLVCCSGGFVVGSQLWDRNNLAMVSLARWSGVIDFANEHAGSC